MNSLREMLIRIRTVFESKGADSVEEPLKDVVKETGKLSEANKKATSEAQGLGQKGMAALTLMRGSAAAARGSTEGLSMAIRGATSLFGRLGIAIGAIGSIFGTIVAAAFMAKKGFDAAFGAYFDRMYGVKKETEAAKARIEDIDKVKLNSIYQEVDRLNAAFSDLMSKIDSVYGRMKAEAVAEIDLEISKLKAQPESTERDIKIADLEKKKSQTVASIEIEASGKRLAGLGDTKRQNEEQARAAALAVEEMRRAAISEVGGESEGARRDVANKRRKEIEREEITAAQKQEEMQRNNARLDEQMERERSNQRVQMIGMSSADYEHTATVTQINSKASQDWKRSQEETDRAIEAEKQKDRENAEWALRTRLEKEKGDVSFYEQKVEESGGAPTWKSGLNREKVQVQMVEKSMQKVMDGNEETLQRIIRFLEKFEGNHQKIRERIDRMPL